MVIEGSVTVYFVHVMLNSFWFGHVWYQSGPFFPIWNPCSSSGYHGNLCLGWAVKVHLLTYIAITDLVKLKGILLKVFKIFYFVLCIFTKIKCSDPTPIHVFLFRFYLKLLLFSYIFSKVNTFYLLTFDLLILKWLSGRQKALVSISVSIGLLQSSV